MITNERVDEMILELPKKQKIKVIKDWIVYAKTLPKFGQKIFKKRILWLKRNLKDISNR